MDQSKGKNQGGKLPDKKSFNDPGSAKGTGKWSGGQSKWSGGDGKKMSLPGKGSKGGKMPDMYGGAQMGNNQGQMPGMVQGTQQGMQGNMPGSPGMWQGGSGMGQGSSSMMPGSQQGMMQGGMQGGQQGMMPGMMQGGQQGMMPGMMQGGPGMVQGTQQGMPSQGGMMQQSGQGQLPPGFAGPPGRERSYIENILRLNRGKFVRVYMSFELGNEQEVFTGTLEEAGKDHIVVADQETGRWYLLLMIYLDYVVFDEELEYEYPFG